MAVNGVNPNSQPLIPIFKGEKYHLWSIKMQTMFRSQELWDIVEIGYIEPTTPLSEPDQKLRDNRKRDAKALFFIQSAVDDDIFPRISHAKTSKEAWEIIKHEYFGDKKVISVKLQSLRSEFDSLQMKDNEPMQSYLSRVSGIVNQMKSYGESISSQSVVSKVLRSLTPNFHHVVAAIEESKDLSVCTFDELMCSLLAHEVRISKEEKVEDKAFQVKGESSSKGKTEYSSNRGRGRGGFQGRGRGHYNGRGRGHYNGRGKGHHGGNNYRSGGYTGDSSSHHKNQVQCNYCKNMAITKLTVGRNREMGNIMRISQRRPMKRVDYL